MGDSAIPVTRHGDLTAWWNSRSRFGGFGHVPAKGGGLWLMGWLTLGAAEGRNCRSAGQRGRGWTPEVHGRLVHFGAALIFVLPACGLLSTAATQNLFYRKLESLHAWGTGHTAGPRGFVSLSSVSFLPVSQHHVMGWTGRLLLNFLVKDLDTKVVN